MQLQFLAKHVMCTCNHKSTCKQLQFFVQHKATSRHNLLLATLQVNRNLGVKKRSDGVNVASAMIGLIITAVAMTLPTGPLKLAGYTAVPVRDLVSHFTRAHAR